jgi:nitroreductase
MLLQKNAATSVPIHDLLTRRWSTRAFDASRTISAAQITALAEAARWAPSCNNGQPWRFLMWNKATDAAGWQKAFDCLSAGNQAWCGNVPLFFLSCSANNWPDGKGPNRYGAHDTGMALFSLMEQATALGLSAHAMAGFNNDKAREVFAIPADFTPQAMLAVGYQAAPDVLNDSVKEKEMAPRVRRPLNESFFAGSWGKPAGL